MSSEILKFLKQLKTVRTQENSSANIGPCLLFFFFFCFAIPTIESKFPFLAEKLTKSIGFAMGIDFREPSLLISPKTEEEARKGMIFNVNVGVSDIPNKAGKDEKSQKFAISIADTVLVNDGEAASILTAGKKKAKNISIFLKDDSSSEEDEADKEGEQLLGRGMRNSSLASHKRDHDTSENKRYRPPHFWRAH